MTDRLKVNGLRLAGFLLLGLVLLAIAFPVYWIVLTAIKPPTLIYSPQPALWTSLRAWRRCATCSRGSRF